MRLRLTHALLVALVSVPSCTSAPSRDEDDEGCIEGETRACVGADDCRGFATCDADGRTGDCICNGGGGSTGASCEALRACCESDTFPSSARETCLAAADQGYEELCGSAVDSYRINGLCDGGTAGSGGSSGDGGAGGSSAGGAAPRGGDGGSAGTTAGDGGTAGKGGAPTGGASGAAGSGGTGGGAGDLPPTCTGRIGLPSAARLYSGAPVDGACQGALDPPYVGFWFSFNDGTSSQTPDPSAPLTGELGGRNGPADCAIRTQGVGFTMWGAGVGFDFDVAQPGRCVFNAGAFRGIRMYLKGTTAGSVADNVVRVKLPTVRTTDQPGGVCVPIGDAGCSDDYGAFCTVSPTTWLLCDLPFSAITQEGWGVTAAFLPQELLGLQFLATRWTTSISFDISIDDIEFY